MSFVKGLIITGGGFIGLCGLVSWVANTPIKVEQIIVVARNKPIISFFMVILLLFI